MIGQLDRFIGDCRGTGRNKRICEGAIGRKVQIGKDDVILADQWVLARDGLFDLDNHVGSLVDVSDVGEDGGTGFDIGLVGEGAALTGGMLYVDIVAMAHKLGHTGGSHANAILALLDFLWDSDFHRLTGFKGFVWI